MLTQWLTSGSDDALQARFEDPLKGNAVTESCLGQAWTLSPAVLAMQCNASARASSPQALQNATPDCLAADQANWYSTLKRMRHAGFGYSLDEVEGGRKVALMYHLVQRSAGPLPVFQNTTEINSSIRKIARDWHEAQLLPKRVFHLLDAE